ncbi:MAG: condensation domain-containing protein, partial [Legionellales bacterium]
ADLKPLPIGVVGDLYLSGVGLATGYLNQPELTQASFIANPFAAEKDHARLYKTGDWVRWTAEGYLDYVGRQDSQVKIRGQRVELKAIEQVLLGYAGVTEAVVLVDKDVGLLVGYCVSLTGIDEAALLEHARLHLPNYMVPNVLVALSSFPVTANGKLDKAALPKPNWILDKATYAAPTTSLELALCEAWQDVLGVDRVGVLDDFFRMGGDSIRSIRLVAKMQALGVHVGVHELFLHKSIRGLLENTEHATKVLKSTYMAYELVDEATHKDILSLYPDALIEDIYPASYLQMEMLLESEHANADGAYHDVFAYSIQYEFNEARLLSVFQQLTQHYPLLRTSFMVHEAYGHVAIQHQQTQIAEHYVGVIKRTVGDLIAEEKRLSLPFDKPGLFRLLVLNPSAEQFSLVFSFHHAMTDGWSVASLMSAFTKAYTGDGLVAQELMPAYQKVIKQEQQALKLPEYKEFWSAYLNGHPDHLVLSHPPMDRDSLFARSSRLSSQLSQDVLVLSKRLRVSPDSIFLAAYLRCLERLLNQKDLVIGLVVNNRLEEAGGDKVFGLHLNIIPFRTRLNDATEQDDFIQALAAERIRLTPYKAYPSSKLASDLNRSTPLFTCAFNYLHFHVAAHQNREGLISTTHAFEKMNIPLTLQILRTYDDRFELSLKVVNQFIDTATATQLLEAIQFEIDYARSQAAVLAT